MKHCTLFLLLVFTSLVTWAQSRVTGKVTDANNNPVEGVSIQVKGSSRGTTSLANGTYAITAPNGATLVFSSTGYATKELKVTGATVDVTLAVTSENLTDVVVVGYGRQKKSNITGAVTTIKGDVLTQRPVTQASMALQGLAPGVTVQQSSGQPGADGGAITIRGLGSINGSSSPLIVVDGVEGASLNDVDPNIIESISVLKDASAAAVYGVRGTNGVILVKTKRGQNGKTSLSVNSFVSQQTPTNMPKTLSAIDNMLLQNESQTNAGQVPLFPQSLIDLYRTTPADNFNIFNTDWVGDVFQNNGILQNHNLIASGGSDKASFLVSGTYLNQQGLIVNNQFKKWDLRMNGDIQLNKRIKFSADLFYTKSSNMTPAGMAPTEIIRRAIAMPRNVGGKYAPGIYGDAGQTNAFNPIAMAENSGIFRAETPTFSARFALKIDILKNLTVDLAYNNRSSFTQSYEANTTYNWFQPNPATGTFIFQNVIGDSSLNYTNSRTNFNQYYAAANYNTTFAGKHNFKAQVGFQANDAFSQSVSATRFGLQFPSRPYLNLATGAQAPTVSGGALDNAVAGAFARINYDYAGKYLLEVTGRYDGTSRFSQVNNIQWGLFPAVSAGWIFTKEEFAKNISWLNYGKLRFSRGTLGNQEVGPQYPFAAGLNSGTAYYFNGVLTRGFSLTTAFNPNLSWERSTQTDVGIELAFLKNRLTVGFDYYEKKVSDIIFARPLPLFAGFTGNALVNIGSMVNKGFEFTTTYSDKVGKNFTYSVTANLSDVRNKVLDIGGAELANGNMLVKAGYAINTYNLLTTNGLYQTGENFNRPFNPGRPITTGAGDVKYVDRDGNDTINALDRRLSGNNFPRYEYSLNLTAAYKNFDINVFIFGVAKRDNYISGVGVEPFNGGNFIASGLESALGRWTPNNPGASYPRLFPQGNGNYVASDFWLRNGAFMRVRSISIGYSLPKLWMQKANIQQFRIYATLVNPITISNYEPGFDPEINNQNGAFYPIMRTATVGINCRF